eukprot:UN05344
MIVFKMNYLLVLLSLFSSTFARSEYEYYLGYPKCPATLETHYGLDCQTGCQKGGCPNDFDQILSFNAGLGGANCLIYSNEICRLRGSTGHGSIFGVGDIDLIVLFIFGCMIGSCITISIALIISKCVT